MHDRERPILLQLDTSKLDLILFVLARQNRVIARIAAQLGQAGGNDEQAKRLTAEVDAETKKMEDALAAFSDPPSPSKGTT